MSRAMNDDRNIRALEPAEPEDLALGLALVEEYAVFSYEEAREAGAAGDLDLDTLRAVIPDFTRFADRYSAPSGSFLVLEARGEPLGSVGVAHYDRVTCEMNRLWVRDGRRGAGLGRALARAALNRGRTLGYERIVLDVVPFRTRAIALYRSLGFVDIPSIHDYPFDIIAMGRDL
jgi:ribosomal protein S18 acetylase RimI-like enzyme